MFLVPVSCGTFFFLYEVDNFQNSGWSLSLFSELCTLRKSIFSLEQKIKSLHEITSVDISSISVCCALFHLASDFPDVLYISKFSRWNQCHCDLVLLPTHIIYICLYFLSQRTQAGSLWSVSGSQMHFLIEFETLF